MIFHFIIIIIFINYFHLFLSPLRHPISSAFLHAHLCTCGRASGRAGGQVGGGVVWRERKERGRGGEAPRAGFTLLVRIIRPAGREELTVYRLGLPLFVFI